ncbi:glycosyltransferase family 29 protein [Brucella intermedia]|uniref:glycosyltransferase family 29 protein n=1 Tax=Brucella intermedia TaxID=94625 RepID=UPI000EFB586A|nr:glycosyltransferase family 29 protein [Brucella intermedia]MCO7725383.1 glycosyltransferase family 29 protein [Brucella intermedia]
MKKTLIIVGNAPLPRDLSAEVDSADFVVRFNEPKQSIGMSGTRTDLLMLATSSKPMQRRLSDPDFLQTPTFKAAKEVMLAYHPSIIRKYHPRPNFLSRLKGRRSDWTMQTIEIIGSAGKEIRIMPPQFYLAGCKELGIAEENLSKTFPSTGFFGIFYMLGKCPQESWNVKICGFTWEGWKRHAWGDERSWVEQKIEAGRISLIR